MQVLDRTWQAIRDKFSEGEREQLRNATCGLMICPPGVQIDPERVPDPLLRKFSNASDAYLSGSQGARLAAKAEG